MPDSPENNFTTLNSIYGNLSVTLSEGNLKYTTGTSVNPVTGTISIPTTGKWYWEVYVSAVGDAMIGVQNRENQQSNGYSGRKTGYYRQGGSGGGSGSIYIEGTGYGGDQASYTNGDVVSVLYNADDMKIAWYKNGSQEGLTFDVTDTDVMPIVYQASGSGSTSGTFNFGQDSTFAGAISAGGNTDANGIGDFKYTVPSGYLALCSDNLPEPTIGPNSATQADDHFNTVTFSGTGSSPLSVTGVGFQPDWIWMKRRDSATNGHNIHYDSTRGGTNALRSSAKSAESQFGDMVVTFASDGFSFTGTDGLNSSSSYSNVAWNWKANGGTTSSNTDGSLTSTVQANTTAGFSIVTWTETTANAQTIGHGLGTTPAMIITKLRDDSALDWYTFHQTLTKSNRISFNSTSTRTASGFWNGTLDNDVFYVGYGDSYDNKSAVAYCFAEIEGFSKFGGYTGNDATDGTFVYTGFSPAFVVLRYVSGSAGGTKNWLVYDNKRSPLNPNDEVIYANQYDAESADSSFDIDLLSNGFKLRNAEGPVNNAAEYLYMAFAEQPFKYANAR
tara:strand:- start:62 stop:1735 length:1674 start_codon:yes stop_codon:yes gene_type:complete